MHKCSQIVGESFSHFKILLISQRSIKCHGETIPNSAEEEGSFGEHSEHSVTEQLFTTHIELINNYSYYNSSWVSHTHAKKSCIKARKSKRS